MVHRRIKKEVGKSSRLLGVLVSSLLSLNNYMSNFKQYTTNPKTGVIEKADWLDNYFGRRIYGVKFPDGKIYNINETILTIFPNCPKCDNFLFKDKKICEK